MCYVSINEVSNDNSVENYKINFESCLRRIEDINSSGPALIRAVKFDNIIKKYSIGYLNKNTKYTVGTVFKSQKSQNNYIITKIGRKYIHARMLYSQYVVINDYSRHTINLDTKYSRSDNKFLLSDHEV